MKAVQKFNAEYLKRCASLSTDDILQFLEDFKNLHYGRIEPQSKLIGNKNLELLLKDQASDKT